MRAAGILAAALALALAGCAAAPDADPVVSDPPGSDAAHPAAMAELQMRSDGDRINALVYLAEGAGPHPLAVLLHGFPGQERNLDLAQAIRRAGWNVLFFHYRGAWGSEGSFSFRHAIEDARAALRLARSPDFAAQQRTDPERIALVGHSMGGFVALSVASEEESVACVAAISPVNLGLRARLPDAAARETAERLDGMIAPLQGTSGAALMEEIRREGERFDLTRRAPALTRLPVLLVAGGRDRAVSVDANHAPLVAALEGAGATRLHTALLPDADHAYSARRIALAREVVGFLEAACGEEDGAR